MLPVSVLKLIHPLLQLSYLQDCASSQRPLLSTTNSVPSLLHFELRHLHAVTSSAHVYFTDIAPSSPSRFTNNTLCTNTYDHPISIQPRRITRHRPSSIEAFSLSRTRSILREESDASLGWEEDEVEAPDVESRETLLVLAKMTSNAYYDGPEEAGWYDLGGNWTQVSIDSKSYVKPEILQSFACGLWEVWPLLLFRLHQ